VANGLLLGHRSSSLNDRFSRAVSVIAKRHGQPYHVNVPSLKMVWSVDGLCKEPGWCELGHAAAAATCSYVWHFVLIARHHISMLRAVPSSCFFDFYEFKPGHSFCGDHCVTWQSQFRASFVQVLLHL